MTHFGYYKGCAKSNLNGLGVRRWFGTALAVGPWWRLVASMKMRKNLSFNLTMVALTTLFWQIETQAQTQRVGVKAVGNRRSKGRLPVGNRRQGRRVRSQLRERARIYEPCITAAAQKHGVDPRVLWTIAFLETRFRPELVSPMKARGLMQFMPATARRFYLSNPHDAKAAIDAAARYVKQLTAQFDGRLELVLAGYNAGEGAVESFLTGRSLRTSSGKVINPRRIKTNGVPPYRETILYVKRGLLVFDRITSAGVFPELVATSRPLRVPSPEGAKADQDLIDRELKELNRTPVKVVYAGVKQVAIGEGLGSQIVARTVDEPVAKEFETVFFDVHSGARYLVRQGEIVKPLLGAVDAAGNGGESGHHVSKSYYFGTGGN